MVLVIIESLAKINGIYFDLTNVSKMDMIVVSYESINGDYQRSQDMIRNNNYILSEDERLRYINMYGSSEFKKSVKI